MDKILNKFVLSAFLIILLSCTSLSGAIDDQGSATPAWSPTHVLASPTVTDSTIFFPFITTPTVTPSPNNGNNFYVTPDGSSNGDGSINNPWNLTTALQHPETVQPGDTIWLREGVYGDGGGGAFSSKLRGTEDHPIILRQYPGERATVNSRIIAYGEFTWFWGFEITNSSPERLTTGSNRPPGLTMVRQGHKAINLIIHNVGHPAIGFWEEVGDGGEIYGCILWGNGLYDINRDEATRGSGIYAQNQFGNRYIREVISFRNFTTGMKVYAENGYVNGFHFEGNISFDNQDRNIFASGREHPITNLEIINNYTYRRDSDNTNSSIKVGYPNVNQHDAIVKDNIIDSGPHGDGAFWVKQPANLIFIGNAVISPKILATWIPATGEEIVQWDNNAYFGGLGDPFTIDDTAYTFQDWVSTTSYDEHSIYSSSYPNEPWKFVRENEYEPERAHIVIYNWGLEDSVEVDVSNVINVGTEFVLLDAQNYFGPPILSGIYDGSLLEVPMNLTVVSPIIGDVTHFENSHTAPEFGVFILIETS